MKATRAHNIVLLFFIFLFLLIGCQKISDLVIPMGSSVSTPQYAATPMRIYSTPLPEFEPMQFVWFYKPPDKSADLGAVAANYSLVIFTRNNEREREELRAIGSDSVILQYLRAEAIMRTFDCSEKPFQNQVANLEGDFCLIENQHPDWFLRDVNGNLIQYDQSDYIFMDPGNSGWQAFYLEKIENFQKDSGWQGVFLDNLDGSLLRFERTRTLLQNYFDDQAYQQANLSFLHFLYSNYFSGRNNYLYANIPYLKDDSVWFDYLEYLDGAMLEAFAADWDNGYLDTQEWLNQLDLAEQTQALGKNIILVTQGNMNDTQRMQFGLASFLLINDGRAFFRYSNNNAYRELWWYTQFDYDLGQPLGPRYSDMGQWRRDFENGYVLVDPEGHTAEIQVN